MFDLLKKKIKAFSEKLSKTRPREETKESVEEKPRKEKPVEKKALELEKPVEYKPEKEKPEERKALVKPLEERPWQKKPEEKIRVSAVKKARAVISRKVRLSEKDLGDYMEEFELSLLEADVEQEVAEDITQKIKEEITSQETEKEKIEEFVKEKVKQVLKKEITLPRQDFIARVKKKKPFVILFLGPNGAGKTTSIAKTAFMLKQKGLNSVLAAADTFRAASIEQLKVHADRLELKMISHSYGADPAAVAFDAVKSAQAKELDAVLIDTAGRQETNVNLMNELKKIARVVKPDLKVFVGEALAGHAIVNQATEYDKEIGLDGFIITKIDADVKGGTIISLIAKLKKPVFFVGSGQEYKDLVEFTEDYLIDRIA